MEGWLSRQAQAQQRAKPMPRLIQWKVQRCRASVCARGGYRHMRSCERTHAMSDMILVMPQLKPAIFNMMLDVPQRIRWKVVAGPIC